MLLALHGDDFASKNFDKLAKLLSAKVFREKRPLGVSRDFFSRALGFRDYHSAKISVSEETDSTFQDPNTLCENMHSLIMAMDLTEFRPDINVLSILSTIPFHNLHFCKKVSKNVIFGPLCAELFEYSEKLADAKLFLLSSEIVRRLFSSSSDASFLDEFSIHQMLDTSIGFEFAKSQVIESAKSMMHSNHKNNLRDRLFRQLEYRYKISMENVQLAFFSEECQVEILSEVARLVEIKSKLSLRSSFFKDPSERKMSKTHPGWCYWMWFPKSYKYWNYIERNIPLPDSGEYDDDNPSPDEKYYIHQKIKVDHGSVLEFYARRVSDPFSESLRLHNWVARITVAGGEVVTHATGTFYMLEGYEVDGQKLVDASNVYSDTDVSHSCEFVNLLKVDAYGSSEGIENEDVLIGEYYDLLVFIQILQKNQYFSNHFYSGFKFIPALMKLMQSATGSELAFPVSCVRPDLIRNEYNMPLCVKRELQRIKSKIESSFIETLSESGFDAMCIIGDDRPYSDDY